MGFDPGNEARHLFGSTRFSDSDVYHALTLVFPPGTAADLVAEWKKVERHLENAGEKPGVVLPHQVMLLLAVLSEENATRVIQHAPELKTTVQELRAQPERWREIYEGYDPNQAGGTDWIP